MIIDDLDVTRAAVGPDEADAPLVVDPNAVLTRSSAPQRFQPVPRRGRQIAQNLGVVQLPQLALSGTLNVRAYPAREAAMEQRLSVPIGERADHRGALYTRRVLNVQRP